MSKSTPRSHHSRFSPGTAHGRTTSSRVRWEEVARLPRWVSPECHSSRSCCHSERSEESRSFRPFAEFILSVAEGLRVTGRVIFEMGFNRLLKKAFSCFDRLSTNGKSPTTSSLPPFALSLSKGSGRTEGVDCPALPFVLSVALQAKSKHERLFQHPVRGEEWSSHNL